MSIRDGREKTVENPATWGKAEKIVNRVLRDHYMNTKSDHPLIGLSLPRQITDALRNAGLLLDQPPA